MKGLALFEQAMEMLGYTSADGISGRDDMIKKALTLINRVYSELYYAFVYLPGGEDEFKPLTDINQEINLPKVVLVDIAPYGLAMFLAQSEGDADSQALYANLYNQKKTRGKKIGRIKDKMPHVWG